MKQRGQTLVLFALTLLLLTLMVAITLSMGARTKEKMELQTAADASAYNGAVAAARTFNSIAVMNRVQAAHMISTLGTLSLISWSTLYWKHAQNAARLFQLMAVPYALNTLLNCPPIRIPPSPICPVCRRGLAQTLALAVLSTVHANTTKNRLEDDVDLFASETQPRWLAAQQIYNSQVELLNRLDRYLSPTGGARAVLTSTQLRASPDVSVQGAGSAVSSRELLGAITNHPGAVADPNELHLGHILMGSRGHPFVRNRREHADWDVIFSSGSIAMRGLVVFAGGHIFFSGSRGASYYDQTWTNAPSGQIHGPHAHDGESGRTRTMFVPASTQFRNWVACNNPLPAFIVATGVGLAGRSVGMNSAKVSADEHEGIGHNVQHAFKTFPPFIDYNAAQLTDMENLHGQPKMVTTLGRDLNTAEVFEPNFNFKFTPQNSGTQLTLGTSPLRQLALGNGLVYYHRPDHSLEPPNLFAPFWRAGLTRFVVDRPSAGLPGRATWDADAVNMFQTAGSPAAGEVFNELKNVGYGGFD